METGVHFLVASQHGLLAGAPFAHPKMCLQEFGKLGAKVEFRLAHASRNFSHGTAENRAASYVPRVPLDSSDLDRLMTE